MVRTRFVPRRQAAYYTEDKLHFNREGYKLWGKSISKQVREIAEKNK